MNFSAALSSSRRGDAGADLARHQVHRLDEDRARRGHLVDLGGGLLDDHEVPGQSRSSRRSVASVARMWSCTLTLSCVPSKRRSSAALLVVVDQRLGLLVVGRQALGDLLRLVVGALLERLAVLVAAALVLGRVELDVVEVPVGALAAAREALDHGLVGRVDQQRRGQPPAALVELLGERVGLRHGAREAVEQEAVVAVLVDLLEDHRDHQIVGHQAAVVHVLLGLRAEVGALVDVLGAAGRRCRCRAGRSPRSGARPGCPCRPPGGPGGSGSVRSSGA